ncbi:MAG: KTSC domain-containing protein [Anaerolineaceae bacterium]|nr:KTSC domain-containing protein [Anaerolineaceae bacterium]
MNRIHVTSSNLVSVGYDNLLHTLEIEFTTGAIYQYFNVPEDIYHGLMNAPSHGGFFSAYIKKGGFSYRKIR